jgi:hypothetical protein
VLSIWFTTMLSFRFGSRNKLREPRVVLLGNVTGGAHMVGCRYRGGGEEDCWVALAWERERDPPDVDLCT